MLLLSARMKLLLLAALCVVLVSPASAQEDFLPPEQAFVFSAEISGAETLLLRYDIAPGYYLYRERFTFTATPEASALGAPRFPTGRMTYDPTFEKNMEVYTDVLEITMPLAARAPLDVLVSSQGCADAGLCYPPMQNRLTLTPTDAGFALAVAASPEPWGSSGGTPAWLSNSAANGAAAFASPASVDWRAASDTGVAARLASAGSLSTIGAFFLLGLLLAFTPCVLPMVPILSALLVRGAPPSRGRGLLLAAAYVAGMSVVYTALGMAAGLSGVGLAAWLQTPWVLAVFAALLALLALAMFEVFTLQLPARWQSQMTARVSRIPGGRITGAALMGAFSALIVGPCVAAPLAGALLYISQTGDLWLGGLALFALAWGMGTPLLLVGASAATLLPRAGAWMAGVKHLFGVLLLASAWWILLPVLASWVQMLGWAVLAALAALVLRAFEPLPREAHAGALCGRALGLLLALVSVLQIVGVLSGGRDPLQPLAHLAAGARPAAQLASAPAVTRIASLAELEAHLAQSRRPVMLDFYADWCVACKEMERDTFSDARVAARLAQFTVLQADVTANSPEERALLRRFRLFGPPGIVFFAADGRLLDERVIGFQSAPRFEALLARVLGGADEPGGADG